MGSINFHLILMFALENTTRDNSSKQLLHCRKFWLFQEVIDQYVELLRTGYCGKARVTVYEYTLITLHSLIFGFKSHQCEKVSQSKSIICTWNLWKWVDGWSLVRKYFYLRAWDAPGDYGWELKNLYTLHKGCVRGVQQNTQHCLRACPG